MISKKTEEGINYIEKRKEKFFAINTVLDMLRNPGFKYYSSYFSHLFLNTENTGRRAFISTLDLEFFLTYEHSGLNSKKQSELFESLLSQGLIKNEIKNVDRDQLKIVQGFLYHYRKLKPFKTEEDYITKKINAIQALKVLNLESSDCDEFIKKTNALYNKESKTPKETKAIKEEVYNEQTIIAEVNTTLDNQYASQQPESTSAYTTIQPDVVANEEVITQNELASVEHVKGELIHKELEELEQVLGQARMMAKNYNIKVQKKESFGKIEISIELV